MHSSYLESGSDLTLHFIVEVFSLDIGHGRRRRLEAFVRQRCGDRAEVLPC